MDDLSFLVQETLKQNELRQLGEWQEEDGEEVWEPVTFEPEVIAELPVSAGIFFHLVHQGGTFIVRTLESKNIKEDHALIIQSPESYPSLRLVDGSGPQIHRLKWFAVETFEEAQAIHGRIGQRRFPLREEDVCNISDPGFSWWMEESDNGFTLHSKMSVLKESMTRLGPLADPKLAPHRLSDLATSLSFLPLKLEVSIENSRFHMKADSDAWIALEFAKIFSQGVISQDIFDIFRLLGKRGVPSATLESSWFFLREVAAVRKFWIKISELLD
ncbi:MAG: hypothetical protein K2P81_14255 [Bacteriovoracaceae bacterium]|nr:hypothetical protein [Bacteriovoracaceae bacterium]